MPTIPLASEDWQLADSDAAKPASLVIELRRQVYVLPYFRFVFAEGDDSRVRIAFASHFITIAGTGLAALLEAMAGNLVVRIVQPTGAEASFGVRGAHANRQHGPAITEITVEQPE
jgi:hypothetical protein